MPAVAFIQRTFDSSELKAEPAAITTLLKKSGLHTAIVYNEAYTSILEDEIEDYSDKVRIIYSCEIVSEAKEIVIEAAKEKEKDDDTFAMYIRGYANEPK